MYWRCGVLVGENIVNKIYHNIKVQYCSGDQVEKNEMGVVCSTYGGEERRVQAFGGETRGKETTWKTEA
jgi:hypothetical protein